MEWNVLFDEDFETWFDGLDEAVQDAILESVPLLRERGPQLGRPHVDTVKGSAFANMKELRLKVHGEPWRILFAFDPARAAILLVGGNKGGDKRWYKTNIPIADERLRWHLKRLGQQNGNPHAE